MRNNLSVFVICILFYIAGFVLSANARQISLSVYCKDGKADTNCLDDLLRKGWKVVCAVPVQDSDSISAFGKPKQSYTVSILFILEFQEKIDTTKKKE